MEYENLSDKSICIVVENLEKKEDVHIYLGTLQLNDDKWLFVNEIQGWRLSLDTEQLSRLKPVPEQLKSTLLNADYFLSMKIQSLPSDDPEGYEKTIMKWRG